MFWALISPLRHTAEPPQLAPDSLLRLFYYHVGYLIARQPVRFIVGSVTCAVILSYPFFLLYSTSSPGLPSIPHHAWTSARQFSSSSNVIPDIAIRQAWVQGSYMGALKSEVLEEALRIQQKLLGTDVFCNTIDPNSYSIARHSTTQLSEPPFLRNISAALEDGIFFHSPLLYWNCSIKEIQQDRDLLETVNANAMRLSPLNMTLHWGSVFAGKSIIHHRLSAVDALVISLFYPINSTVGEKWDERATNIAQDVMSLQKYDVYPSSGWLRSHTFYEFVFQPMSDIDYIVVIACYALTVAYLYIQLSGIGAVKSRTGLVIAIITQIAASVMSSFTILALLKYPVSHIPREVFPFVVMVIGVENMARLMNAVMNTPPEHSTANRIATAVGEVGFLSTVAVATDIAILALVGHISVPAVAEFCWFAGVALVVDFILHFCYFLAVLSVDVRRIELQDFLDKANLSTTDVKFTGRQNSTQQRALDRLTLKGSPISTRIAGSAIMICVLIALNMHFFDNETPWRTFQSCVDYFHGESVASYDSSPSAMPLNQARTPNSWLKLQDQLTGKELIQNIKPGSHKLIAKVYDPLFVVLKNSNRSKSKRRFSEFFHLMDLDVLKDHSQNFFLVVILAAAGVTLLMNHMLLNDLSSDQEELNVTEAPLLSTQTLYEGHSLDVVLITACPKGILVSVGLDHRIVIWNLRGKWGPIKNIISPACLDHSLWPVMAITLDDLGEWLAVAPRTGPISFWQVSEGSFYRSFRIELHGQTPSAFFFAPAHENSMHGGPRLIIVRPNGWLSEVNISNGQMCHHRICTGTIVSSSYGVATHRMSLKIVTACQQGRIFVTSRYQGDWTTDQLHFSPTMPIPTPAITEPCTILPLPVLGMVVSSRSCNVELVDLLSGSVVKTFQVGQFKPSTLRAFHAKRRTCLYCGCPSVESFSIAYTEKESEMLIMHTFLPANGRSRDICLRAERDRREKKCTGFEIVEESMHWMEHVEGWEVTTLNMIAGVRRIDAQVDGESSDDSIIISNNTHLNLRRRRQKLRKTCMDDEEWEAWTMTADGVINRYPLVDKSVDSRGGSLLVGRTGPVTRVGQRSIALGFGNTIKLLLLGNERYDDDDDTGNDLVTGAYRKRYHRR